MSTGLTLNTSSFKTTETEEYVVEKLTIEQQYQFSIFGIQVPVLLHYRVGKFNAGIGGFGALAISGQLKFKRIENQSVENTYDQGLVFNSKAMEYADFRPFNAGLRAELGYGIKRLRVSAFFDAGLLNSSPKTASGDVEFQQYPLRRSTLGFLVVSALAEVKQDYRSSTRRSHFVCLDMMLFDTRSIMRILPF
ncbi:MAG: outer membrane beta-barrel protein [Haliscomenobacter sp.]|nr:outer membrane beta-barrel protein [Haliscomenobacter sp.]MBK9489662.1 outer membrane beta-barrel protein [Haliscomenobacter sp.]